MGKCMSRHRHQEWIIFLKMIAKNTPPNKVIHVICDNYATHKHAKIQLWHKKNSRFQFHFTPTSASWLNMGERFFRDLTDKSICRGIFHTIEELVEAIEHHIQVHNSNPKPFVWTDSASNILEKVKRGRTKLNNMQSA